MTTKTKERPIIFSGAMVKAILEGRKTMTRRVVTKAHARKIGLDIVGDDYVVDYCEWNGKLAEGDNWSPYGVPGDRLWVREKWADIGGSKGNDLWYAANVDDATVLAGKWRSPYHMPRWASRITLEVTGVRVERLQEITEADAIDEGAPCVFNPDYDDDDPGDDFEFSHVSGFVDLWDTINGKKHPWASNPWVWVVSFTPTPTGPGGD